MNSLEERLISACIRGDLNTVSDCLKRGANMNRICSTGRTALGVAAQLGNSKVLKLLLKTNEGTPSTSDGTNLGYFVVIHGDPGSPEIKVTNCNDIDCIHDLEGIDFDDFNDTLIVRHSWMPDSQLSLDEIVTPDGMDDLEWEEEIEENKDVDPDEYGALYLWYANILAQTGALLEEKPPPDDVDAGDQFGCTALHYATAEGHSHVINMLISAGCKVNAEDADNFSPLHLAASKDRVEIVHLLLDHGANPHQRSSTGSTPLHVSASRGIISNVRALVEAGANVNISDIFDRTPLYLAVNRRDIDVVHFLIDAGAKVNLEDIHGNSPLFEAVTSKDVDIVQALLAAGAKVTQSQLLLHYAILHRQEDMVRALIGAGAIVNLRDESGDTPLILAIKTGSTSIARLLLENGASVNCVNFLTQLTAIHEAIFRNIRSCDQFVEVLGLLEDFGWDWRDHKGALRYAVSIENYHAVASLIKRCHIAADKSLPDLNEIMNVLLLRGNRFLAELLLDAGFSAHHLIPYDSVGPLPSWFVQYKTQPLSLKDVCRLVIRRVLCKNIPSKVRKLRLPGLIQRYLRLDDVYCSCQC